MASSNGELEGERRFSIPEGQSARLIGALRQVRPASAARISFAARPTSHYRLLLLRGRECDVEDTVLSIEAFGFRLSPGSSGGNGAARNVGGPPGRSSGGHSKLFSLFVAGAAPPLRLHPPATVERQPSAPPPRRAAPEGAPATPAEVPEASTPIFASIIKVQPRICPNEQTEGASRKRLAAAAEGAGGAAAASKRACARGGRRTPWSADEDRALREGLGACGGLTNKWEAVRARHAACFARNGRSAVNLKDRARTLGLRVCSD